jgi:hypothetical protein
MRLFIVNLYAQKFKFGYIYIILNNFFFRHKLRFTAAPCGSGSLVCVDDESVLDASVVCNCHKLTLDALGSTLDVDG